MLLQRFTENTNRCGVVLLALCVLVLAGCASSPSADQPGGSKNVQVGANGQPIEAREIPAKAQTLYEQAVSSMAAGHTTDAELRFQEFLLQYPDYPGAHVNLAIIFAGRGDDQSCENALIDALILDPQHAVALNQLGMLLRRQGKFLEAESAYLKAVTASPDYALAHYNLGVLNDLYLKRLDAALQHYEHYQAIMGEEDDQVTKWIADLKRRIGAAQRSANVTE
jgi:Tfp pilus assembly protein PilF